MSPIRECLIGLCITICIQYTVNAEILEWLPDLANNVKNKYNVYQVLLLFDMNEKSEGSIAHGISTKFPTVTMDFQDATNDKASELSKLASFSSPRSTMYIIVNLSKDTKHTSKLNVPIDFVSNISDSKSRSKCLIILPQERRSFTYLKLLNHLWTKQFLDVTILELCEEKKDDHLFPKVSESSKKIAIIHQWNPFTKDYQKFQYTPAVSWFPDKTGNLNGYQMKVGVFKYRPLAFLERDDEGEVQKIYGSDVELSKSLSKAMNFNIIWISPKNENFWGVSAIPREKSGGHMYRIMHNELHYIALESGRFATPEENLYEWTKGTKFVTTNLVVPILENKSAKVMACWEIMNAFIIIGLILLPWVLSHVFHFDRKNWSLPNIIQLVLGLTTPQEPQKLAERIVFGVMLLSCMMNSSFIFTAITNVSLTVNSEVRFETLEDVISARLHTVLIDFVNASLYENVKASAQHLLKKAEVVPDYEKCLEVISEKKNCSFFMRADLANWRIQKQKDSSGRPIMKLVKESITSTVSGLIMERRSPFVERFDQLLLRMIQSGLIYKWQHAKYDKSCVVNMNETEFASGSETTLLQKQISYILFFGYSASVIAFIFEVLFVFLKKNQRLPL